VTTKAAVGFGVIVRSAGLLLAAVATVARASRDDTAADLGREVSLDFIFLGLTAHLLDDDSIGSFRIRTLLLSSWRGWRVSWQGLDHRPRRRGPPSWRGHQPCIPSFP